MSAAQAAFVNRLLAALSDEAPSVDPRAVLLTGASELHNVFSSAVLAGVLEAYMVGLKAAFADAIAFAGTALCFSMVVPFGRLPTHVGKKSTAMAA